MVERTAGYHRRSARCRPIDAALRSFPRPVEAFPLHPPTARLRPDSRRRHDRRRPRRRIVECVPNIDRVVTGELQLWDRGDGDCAARPHETRERVATARSGTSGTDGKTLGSKRARATVGIGTRGKARLVGSVRLQRRRSEARRLAGGGGSTEHHQPGDGPRRLSLQSGENRRSDRHLLCSRRNGTGSGWTGPRNPVLAPGSASKSRRPRGHAPKEAWAVAFAPDGHTLASAGDDGCIRLWDVETAQQREVLRGHNALVSSIAFSPDGAHPDQRKLRSKRAQSSSGTSQPVDRNSPFAATPAMFAMCPTVPTATP